MITRNQELATFLQCKYNEIGEELYAVEPRIKIPETDQRIIYENSNQNIVLTYSFKGAFKGQVYLYVNEEQNEIFSRLLDFAKYLEVCKRKETKPEKIEKYLKDVPQKEFLEEEDRPELPTEKSKLISFLHEEDRIALDEEVNMKTPDRLSIDGKDWSLENFSYETANQILDKLYSGQYTRIEITYKEFYERKGRKIPLNMTSLVYLCEEGKAVVQYFEEKELFTGIFFEDRNGAGFVDTDLLPRINIRGKEIFEQNIVLNLSILGKLCMEMLLNGCIDYNERGNGYFSRRYFSNKNAYIKYRDEKGEFA